MIIKRVSNRLIHIGDNTQNQDQVITPKSFNVIKTNVSNPANPIPPEDAVADTFPLSLLL